MDLFKICIFNCNIVSSTSRFSYLIILTTLVLELSEHALQDRPFGQVKPNSNHKSKSRDLILFIRLFIRLLLLKKYKFFLKVFETTFMKLGFFSCIAVVSLFQNN